MNEALLILNAALGLGFVLAAFMLGRSWLYASIILNLTLISILGQKIVSLWGYSTNVGNVFYVSVVFALFLIMEHFGRTAAIRALWLSAGVVAAGMTFMQITLPMQSPEPFLASADLLSQALVVAPRFAFASITAFLIAQNVCIWLYLYQREEIDHLHWWLKAAAVILLVQLLDSLIFFTIAFWGIIPSAAVVEGITAGYVIKSILGLLTIPLLYLSHRLRHLALEY